MKKKKKLGEILHDIKSFFLHKLYIELGTFYIKLEILYKTSWNFT